jgi:putative NIF3 family GTP cyclohydrolase 1 type 2
LHGAVYQFHHGFDDVPAGLNTKLVKGLSGIEQTIDDRHR